MYKRQDASRRRSIQALATLNVEDFRRMSVASCQFTQEASIERPLSTNYSRPISDMNSNEDADVIKNNAVSEDDTIDKLEDFVHTCEFEDSKLSSWDDGVLVDTHSSESSVENPQSMESRERGLCTEFHEADKGGLHSSSSSPSGAIELDDLSIDSSNSLGSVSVPIVVEPPPTSLTDVLLSAGVIEDADLAALDELHTDKRLHEQSTGDDDALLLYYMFSDFSTPAVSLKSVKDILKTEARRDFPSLSNAGDKESIPLPRDVVVNVEQKSKVLSVILYRNHQLLLQIPKVFLMAFFRLLIRLLTNETDFEYNERTLLLVDWREEITDGKASVAAREEERNADPSYQVRRDRSRRTGGSNTDGDKSQGFLPFQLDDENRDHSSRKDALIYTMVRLQQCGTICGSSHGNSDKLAARKLIRVFDVIKGQKGYRHLLAPVARLLGLTCAAGVSERVLRRILTLASAPVVSFSQIPLVARLLLVRALQIATEGSSRSIFLRGKTSFSNFFSFGGGKGLRRTISGLSAWPFRNDFGMAVWFRAETFASGNSKYPVLLSVRSEDGGGIEISIMPLENDSHAESNTASAAVLVISVFDSDPDGMEEVEVQRLRMPGCILLPRIWYHVAVRHTRSRMKGVFSLSTRQQVLIMLDGKMMTTESLTFPRVSNEDFSRESKAAAFLQKAVRRSISRTGMSLTVALGEGLEGQTGSLYLFHENVSDATLRSIYEIGSGAAGTVVKARHHNNRWDSRRCDIVRKSKLLDVAIKKDDADEIVVCQRRHSNGDLVLDWVPASSGTLAVMDFGEGEDQESFELPADLSMASFSSKLFLVWDPARSMAVADIALDLHIGAHVKMADGGVQAWQVDGAQDVIGSVGGVQALLTLFETLLCGGVENMWREVDADQNFGVGGARSSEGLWSTIPDLISLVASFVRDHGENARELLRCGGVDVIESFVLCSRKIATNNPSSSPSSLFWPLTTYPKLSSLLIESLLALTSAGSHCVGLETKVFSRLLFNIPLWCSGTDRCLSASLDITLLPVLSSIAKANPKKVRDCVGIKDMVFLLKIFADSEQGKVSTPPFVLLALVDTKTIGGLINAYPACQHTRQ